jgi:3-hydroxyacyl-[acyl-carrier-protein] dehydratase
VSGFGDVLALLPGSDVLVDRVVRCEPGTMIETHKAISGAEPCYEHVGAGLPTTAYDYPPDLLLESFTQSACLLWARSGGATAPQLAGVRGVTFHDPVRPGVVVRTVVKVIPGTAATMFFTGRSSVIDGPLVMTVDNLVLAVPPPNDVSITGD